MWIVQIDYVLRLDTINLVQKYGEIRGVQDVRSNHIKIRLILSNNQGSDSLSGKRMDQSNMFRRYKKGIFVAIPFVIFLIFYPIFTNAGFFSLNTLFNEESSQKEEIENIKPKLNSQNVPLLQTAINLDPDISKGGADIHTIENKALIAEAGIGGSFVEISEKRNDKISVYEVKAGDSISQIAEMFGVTPNTIRWANDFEGSIQPGQKLVILPIDGLKHTVKSGGTVHDIARIYGADAREIALFNGISEDKQLNAGDEIIVPHAEKLVPKSESKPKTSTTKNIAKSSSSTTASTGKSNWMIHPVPNAVKTQGVHGYNAIDLAAPIGSPIYAAASGQVILSKIAGWNGGYAKYIVIEHANGVQTLYAHNNANYVTVGQRVEQGQVIGEVGNTGNSTGPHVHFEVRGAKNPF
jgi:LysM repeat protein